MVLAALLVIWCCGLTASATESGSSTTASFFGGSYVAVPLQEARSTTELSFRFRTRRPDAMLFLAAGRTDYCLLRLESGRLKVHINVGAGEREISSPKALRLDDLEWHEVVLSRAEAAVTLRVDAHYTVKEKLPGRFFELNVHFGLYVGGLGDFSELFLGHLDALRGCMADVRYNGADVLLRARERVGDVDVHGVTWACAPEFDAGLERAISFVEDGAFMALPNVISRTGVRWHVELKTTSERGVLLYNSGLASQSDFVALELLAGKARLLLNKGNGAVELKCDAPLADGRWHSLSLHFNPTFMEMNVDGGVSSASQRLPQGGSRFLDLADTLYVGGIELNKRARALAQGVQAADASFRGCLRGMQASEKQQRLGLPSARATQGVLPDCVWTFPCHAPPPSPPPVANAGSSAVAAAAGQMALAGAAGDGDGPCVAGARCIQHGVDSFRCECDQPLCVKPDFAQGYKVFSKAGSAAEALEIVSLSPLRVAEGANALLTSRHVDVVLDYPKYGVRASGVLLHVAEGPRHGRLEVEVWDRGLPVAAAAGQQAQVSSSSSGSGISGASRSVFTLLDISKDKVRYLHDGSEQPSDSMQLELELSAGAGFTLPGYLQGRHRFVLPVNVTPVNDPPSLALPAGKVLRLAQGTRKLLTSDLLQAEDPDSPADSLVYTVLRQTAAGSGGESGYVERVQAPGTPIDSFTQSEVEQGLIAYVHKGGGGGGGGDASGSTARLALQVSDGIETSSVAFLRIAAYPLQIRLVNNSGLVLVHKSSARLTSANLSFDTNADPDAQLDVRYEVVRPPQFGMVQRLRPAVGTSTGAGPSAVAAGVGDAPQWQTVDHFTGHQVAREQIRYLHTTGTPAHDEFKFKVSALETQSPTVFDFRVTFAQLRLALVRNAELQLNGSREAALTPQHLQYRTQPLATDSALLAYRLQRPPRYGALHLAPQPKHRRLQAGDGFSQQDLNAGRVRYRLHRKAYSHVRDDFTFYVTAPDCDAESGTFSLLHVPSGKTREEVRATLERLQVPEGGRQAVLRSHLHLETEAGVTELVYNVTHGPHHGRLDVLDVGPGAVLRRGTNYFSSRELLTERVFYVHDGSETRRDAFHFVALSSEEEDFQYVGVFHVDVLLRNDNTPVRAVDKVFHVVSGGERLLTGRDLRYSDADIDTQPSDIVYTRRGIPNGGIFKAADPTVPLFEFSQDDLDHNRVLFRHEGEDYGKVGLWITDGVFYANGVLEVKASPPFVEVANNTGLVVQHGGSAPLTIANLSADTNLNIWGDQMVYEVLEGPHYGHLQLEHEPESLKRFTQLDLENALLTYHHEGGAFYNDEFHFRVGASGTTTDGKFGIRVFPSSYWEPLIVAINRTLHVEESTSVAITASSLKVMHPQIPATDITYIVVEPPSYGYLEIEPVNEGHNDQTETEDSRSNLVSVFEQALINEGRLYYIQSTANKTHDQFVVDVTNGISWLKGLVIRFIIVPEWLYIGGSDIEVAEGGTVTLPPSVLPVLTEYYRGRVSEFRIIKPPQSGVLQYSREPGQQLQKFTVSQLKAGVLQYQHDGSETPEDQFVVTGYAGEKKSAPATVKIIINPVNDEPPYIMNNTGFRLWEGATKIITNYHLAAVDKDTPPENLTFAVLSVRSGFLALVTKPTVSIQKFTQEEIDKKLVAFVHKGGKGAGFNMTVSDGEKTTSPLPFMITACKVSLQLVASTLLHVFPLRKQYLSNMQLMYRASDYNLPTARPVTFSVTTPPALGRLWVDSVPPGNPIEAINFTQQDVNNSLVYYEHTHPFFGLSTNDSFVFDVRADFAEPLADQTMIIDISIVSGGLDQFLVMSPLEVEEGGTVKVFFNTSRTLDFLESQADVESPSLLMVMTSALQHGQLQVSGSNITSFTQAQMDAGEVQYQHDHSDTLQDELQLSLLLEPGDVMLCNTSLPIYIIPINDQPFRLVTQAPHISVVQGQIKTITKEDLLTEDPDTLPEDITYIVITGPSQGRLLYRNASNNESMAIVKFTQADINGGNIVYEHSGRLQLATFYFRVWDGHFNPEYTVFNIHVLPVSLNVTSSLAIKLQQGSSVAVISREHLITETNVPIEGVRYNVSKVPRHGAIYVNNAAAVEFTQADLDNRSVIYMQTDMTTASDTFEITAWVPGGGTPVTGIEMNVNVEPLIKIGNFSPIAGTKTRITLDVLDASPLAKLTNSNPNYQVLRRPRLGKIKKIIRSSGEKRTVREKDVMHFSHEEIKSGVIYYVVRRLPDQETDGANDRFPFLLAASIFQPALGELKFHVRPEHANDISPVPTVSAAHPPRNSGPRSPEGHEGPVASPNMSSDSVLIVSMVLGVVVLAILVIVVVKCRSVHMGREESRTCKSDLSGMPPVPLPRPPDDLQATSPHPKRFAPPNSSPTPGTTPTPTAMLQCKVIPLEPVESVASSEPDLNSRYPYGVPDEPSEDWSSYDTSELAYPPRTTNPMLRRNQYWV